MVEAKTAYDAIAVSQQLLTERASRRSNWRKARYKVGASSIVELSQATFS